MTDLRVAVRRYLKLRDEADQLLRHNDAMPDKRHVDALVTKLQRALAEVRWEAEKDTADLPIDRSDPLG